MPSAIATKFGLRDLANTVVAVTDQDQSTYYSFDNPSGLTNNSWIQLDFGYPVDLKYFRLFKNAGCIGDFVVVCSNNPATNGTDYFVAGDVMTSVFRDLASGTPPDANYNGTITRTGGIADGTGQTAGQPNISYFTMPPTSARYRYYRIVPAGTLPISSDLALNELVPDIAVGIKVVGFPSSPTDSYKTVDGDLTTYWTPVAASFASERVIPIGSPFVTLTEVLPFIQFDFGEPVSMAALFCSARAVGAGPPPVTYTAFDPTTKGAAVALSNSNRTATATTPSGDQPAYGPLADSISSGKIYIEYTWTVGGGGDNGVGIAMSQFSTASGLGNNGTYGAILFKSGNFYISSGTLQCALGGVANGDVVAFAIDFGNSLIWVKNITQAGNWNASGTADPASGAGGKTLIPGNFQPAVIFSNATSGVVTLNAGNATFAGTVPSGFTAGWPTNTISVSTEAYDSAHKTSNAYLDYTNHIVSNNPSGGNEGALGTISNSTGKRYLEFSKMKNKSGWVYGVGLSPSTWTLGTNPQEYVGINGGVFTTTGSYSPAAMSAGIKGDDVLAMAFDFAASRMYLNLNGAGWFGLSGIVGGADPVAGTGGYDITGVTLPAFPNARVQFGPGAQAFLNCGDIPFSGTIPSGYTAWDGTSGASGGGSGYTTSTGALGDCHLVASAFDVAESAAWDGGTHLDLDIGQALRANISSGVALTTNLSADAKYRYYRLVFGQNAGPNGDQIVEFKFGLQSATKYVESDFDSLFSVGDRIANGMMATGTTGFLTGVGAASDAFNNNFSASPATHFQVGAGDTPAGSLWWWDFGAFNLEIDGLAWSSASGAAESTNGTFELVGGINPTTYWPSSYANEFSETNWSQTGSFQGVPPTVQTDFTPARSVAWAFYGFKLTTHQASYTGSWLADEMFIKVRHSNLDGGDRRNLGGTRPDKYVVITTDSSVGFGTIDTTHLDATGLLDGVYEYQNAGSGGSKGKYSYIQTVSGSSPKQLNTVGQWIKFQFPRNVTPLHLCFVVANTKETYSGANPVSYGKWHWEYSDNNTSWTSIGSSWSFTEGCYFMVAPRQSALSQGSSANAGFGLDKLDFTGHRYWRMVLDAGPAFGTGPQLAQVMFNLKDSGNTQTFYTTNYSDGDTGDSLIGWVPTVTAPAAPFSGVAFSDNVDDALSGTPTITRGLFLRVNFDDFGDEFDAISSDIQPRSITQTVTFITGK